MTPPDPAVEAAMRQIVADYALGSDSVHMNWRCGYPDTYGPCGCVDEFVRDSVAVLEPLIRAREYAAWDLGWEHYDDQQKGLQCPPTDCNPYREGADQ